MKIEVLTALYEFNHGKRPRGAGPWCFTIGTGQHGPRLCWFNTRTYGEAVRQAKAKARELGETHVIVCS